MFGADITGRSDSAFTGDEGVCASLRGHVGLYPVVGSGDHILQATGRGALHAVW